MLLIATCIILIVLSLLSIRFLLIVGGLRLTRRFDRVESSCAHVLAAQLLQDRLSNHLKFGLRRNLNHFVKYFLLWILVLCRRSLLSLFVLFSGSASPSIAINSLLLLLFVVSSSAAICSVFLSSSVVTSGIFLFIVPLVVAWRAARREASILRSLCLLLGHRLYAEIDRNLFNLLCGAFRSLFLNRLSICV